ncbi:methylamine utilization protein [uncultured Paraglaciecola sp.]|uniref:methylamine utilization protein n=1 Tax=uncultured Paraglaciecola sp. TaxID=1765024 RepID=UPI0030D7B3C9|tara:strand:+ start:60100 stop:60786 length:687 start_codon:yes stop_codon:yes gene_type:complete
MNIQKFSLENLMGITVTFSFVLVAAIFICPVALAETLQIKDQFGHPIENVVISFTTTETTETNKVDVLTMDQIDKQFAPQVLVVQKNQTVSFPNSDNIRHHLYSFSKPKPFEFRMFKGGESKKLVFDQAGIVVLGCNIHDQMVGYIYVADKEQTVMTDAQGLAEVPAYGIALKLWHANLSTNKMLRKDIQLPLEYNDSPYPIVLTLLEDMVTPAQHTFKSKKFDRGNK